jgi:uncharacterized protein YndB with AHSA1/START domain
MENQNEHELGIIRKKIDGLEVRFESIYKASGEVVWDAITNPEKMAVWFTDIEMDFVLGGKIVIRFRDADKTESFGKIIRIKKPELFEFSWDDELATWELFEVGPRGVSAKCRLVLTYSKLAKKYAFSVPAGWHVLLDQLEKMLNGSKERYPFGGEETEAARKMRAIYKEIVARQFPELIHETND